MLTTTRAAAGTAFVGKTSCAVSSRSPRANPNRACARDVGSAVARLATVDEATTSSTSAVDYAGVVWPDWSSSASSASSRTVRNETNDVRPTSIDGMAVTGRRRAMMRFAGASCVAAVGWASGVGPSEARAMATVRAERAIRRDGGEIEFTIRLPIGYHFTEGANSRFEVIGGDAGKLFADAKGEPVAATRKVKVDPDAMGDADAVRVNCTVYFCREDDVCLLQRVQFEVPVSETGEDEAQLSFAVPPEASDAPMSAVPSFD